MSALILKAEQTPWSSGRSVQIEGLTEDDALKLAEVLIVPFLRITGGDVTIKWTDA